LDVRSLAGCTALVTGAASGIGRASAFAFAERGADLVLCDLNEAALDETAERIRDMGREVFAQRVDVARGDQMAAFADAVHERTSAVDILMNNAGVALGGGFLDTTLEDWDWILSTNLRGVVHGCHFFVPRMVERGRGGHVINVASAAGYFASEGVNAYATSKFAVIGLSEALREELARHGIGVTAVCPGIIDTPITRSLRLRGPAAEHPDARRLIVEASQRRAYAPERVARNVLKAVQRNRAVAPITPEAWVFYYLKRLAPGLLRRISAFFGARNRRRLGLE
jgi:NAD(P)-dependent dehydrogenase (short-subunit alcohol dehydrogenase family)